MTEPARNPCFEHGCTACCWETEMPLLASDVERLEATTGKRADEFSERRDGMLRLRNVDDGGGRPHCVFLQSDGRCGVYEHRPEGCRLYPLVWDADAKRPVLDHDCPFRQEFKGMFSQTARLQDVVRRLEAEDD